MKKIILLLLLISSTQIGNSQFLKELKKEIAESAKKAVKRKAKKETEKKVDATMDSVLNPTLPKRNKKESDQSSSESETSESNAPNFSEFLKPGKCDSVYNYDLIVTTQIVTAKKKSLDTTYMQMGHNETSSMMKMTDQKMLVITDWKNQSSVMINTQNISYSVINLNAMSRILNSKKAKKEMKSANDLVFTKTGKTKVICNLTCYEYIANDGDLTYEMWGTNEIDFDYEKHKENISKMTQLNVTNTPEDGGYLMEVTTYKKGKLESKMRVTNINTTYPVDINLNNYKKN